MNRCRECMVAHRKGPCTVAEASRLCCSQCVPSVSHSVQYAVDTALVHISSHASAHNNAKTRSTVLTGSGVRHAGAASSARADGAHASRRPNPARQPHISERISARTTGFSPQTWAGVLLAPSGGGQTADKLRHALRSGGSLGVHSRDLPQRFL